MPAVCGQEAGSRKERIMPIVLLVTGAGILVLAVGGVIAEYIIPIAAWRWAAGTCGVNIDIPDNFEPKL